jgi:hypothetical protein
VSWVWRGKPLGYLVLQRRAQGLKTIRACVDVLHGVQHLETPPDLRYRRLDAAHEGLHLRALRLERSHLLARRVLGRLDGRLQLGRQGTGGGVDVLRAEVVQLGDSLREPLRQERLTLPMACLHEVPHLSRRVSPSAATCCTAVWIARPSCHGVQTSGKIDLGHGADTHQCCVPGLDDDHLREG